MPILTVKVSGTKNAETTRRITDLLLDLTTRILGKKREVTAIALDYVDPDLWLVGGMALSAQRKASFYVDIKITDETNTKDEKARYIAEAFAGFQAILGEVHEESYIHVHDVRATPMASAARRRSGAFTTIDGAPRAGADAAEPTEAPRARGPAQAKRPWQCL